MIKPISISLSPNTEKDDVWLAFKLLFQPWRWQHSKKSTIGENSYSLLENEFQKYLGVKYAFAFNSGRAGLLAILSALEGDPSFAKAASFAEAAAKAESKGKEVLLQAFTCNAVPNPILWAGLKPVYVDCKDNDYNMDVEDLERKITPQSRAVVVQHTFGLPADMDRMTEICNRRNLILIEDCAHALGATYKGKKVGTFGKAAFFSFSRDKVISCVYGGMAVTNDLTLAKNLRKFQESIGYPSLFWTLQQLWHPVLMNLFILPTYKIFGKYLLLLFQWVHILSKAVHWKEKRGVKPAYFPKCLPNALAVLALNQFGKLDKFNAHRKEVARYYASQLKNTSFLLPKNFAERENIFLRFVIQHPRAHEIIRKAWNLNLLIGDWYTSPIAPEDTRLDAMGYEKGSCPVAEKLSQEVLNLPTHIHISEKESKIVIDSLLQDIGVYL